MVWGWHVVHNDMVQGWHTACNNTAWGWHTVHNDMARGWHMACNDMAQGWHMVHNNTVQGRHIAHHNSQCNHSMRMTYNTTHTAQGWLMACNDTAHNTIELNDTVRGQLMVWLTQHDLPRRLTVQPQCKDNSLHNSHSITHHAMTHHNTHTQSTVRQPKMAIEHPYYTVGQCVTRLYRQYMAMRYTVNHCMLYGHGRITDGAHP